MNISDICIEKTVAHARDDGKKQECQDNSPPFRRRPFGFTHGLQAMATSTFKPTEEQKAAIAYRGGHLQIIACAGSGKTEAMSRRVCALIEEGVEPSQVIAFTFTERAAASLQTRIKHRISEAKGDAFLDRLGPMYIGTIHAYCLQMLQNHVPQYGNFDILDENRLAGLLSREYRRLGIDKLGPQHWRPIRDFVRNADVVENELIDHAKLKGTAFGDALAKYTDMLDRYHFLTFGQLIATAVRALKQPEVFKRVHESLRHLIVDEYQDINPAQEQLIELLAKPPVHLCVVGDDDQSIYQWRGSDVSNILNFAKRYKAESKPLTQNRRCRPRIIETANTFAKSIKPRLKKEMKKHRPAGGPEVHSWAAETVEAEAKLIADTVQQLVKRGYRYKDVAILYRSVRTSSPPLIAELRSRDIPFRCAGRTGLFLQPEAAAMGRVYAWLCDNDWKCERFETPQQVDFVDLVNELQQVFSAGKKIAALGGYLNDWKASVDSSASPVNLVRDFYKLLNLLGVQKFNLDDSVESARMGCLARFSQILADYEHVTRRARWIDEDGTWVYRGGTDRGRWLYLRLFNYLQHYALDAYEDFEGEDTFDLDVVDILTIHQAKGLEWPVVFVPCLVDGRFPSKYAGKSQEWLLPDTVFPAAIRRRYEGGDAEERRLFYVAMTRARDMLYMSRFQRKKNRFQPSPYLVEVAGGDPALAKRLPLPDPYIPSTDSDDDLPQFSFSELAHYEGCPMRYRLSDSLGFQPQLATELGYGKTIHHVLRRVADLARQSGKLPTAKQIEKLFDDEFYLPFANQAAFDQLAGRAKALIDKYLGDYSGDLLRVWESERPFSLHLANGIVNGRADVILDREGHVVGNLALVDYKTSTDPHADDVYAFQLAIYAAAGRGEGLNVQAAYLHRLKEGDRTPISVGVANTDKARHRASDLITSVVAGSFPAIPEKKKCRGCDVRAICAHALCNRSDL